MAVILLSQSIFGMEWSNQPIGDTTEKAPISFDGILKKYTITDPKEITLLDEIDKGQKEFSICLKPSPNFYYAAIELAAKKNMKQHENLLRAICKTNNH